MTTSTTARRSGFTIIELLIVIAILATLVALTMAVGGAVLEGAKKRQTTASLQILDSWLASYIAERDDLPPPLMGVPRDARKPEQWRRVVPVIDGSTRQGKELIRPINSVGMFMHQVSEVASIKISLEGLDPKLVQRYNIDRAPVANLRRGQPIDPDDEQPEIPTMFDAWGNPMRYVHPAFDGIILRGETRRIGMPGKQVWLLDSNSLFGWDLGGPAHERLWLFHKVRRNKLVAEDYTRWADDREPKIGDSDGGLCISNRPYFYSSGPDGDPSTIEDNVYTQPPRFVEPEF